MLNQDGNQYIVLKALLFSSFLFPTIYRGQDSSVGKSHEPAIYGSQVQTPLPVRHFSDIGL